MLVLTYIIRLYVLYIDSIITTVFVNTQVCIPSMSRETESKLVCKCSTFIRHEKVKPAPVLWHYTTWRQLANLNLIFISHYVLWCGTYHGQHPSVLQQVNISCKGHWQGQKVMSLNDNLNSTTAHETIPMLPIIKVQYYIYFCIRTNLLKTRW